MKVSLKLYFFNCLLFFFFSCTVNTPSYENSLGDPKNHPPPYGPPFQDPNAPPFQDPNAPPFQDPNAPQNPAGTGNRVLDFPYELIPDTLTALTCPNSIQIAGYPFALSLGAYVNHGLQLSQSFKENNQITSRTDPQKVRYLLERSPYKSVRARLALRDENDLRTIYGNANGQPLQAWFPQFNNPSTWDHLSRLIPVFTARSSSVQSVGRGGRFEALLPITGQELNQYAEGLIPATLGRLLLTLTYTVDGKTPILSDLSGGRLPYGRGYKIEFADYYPPNYLIDVQEDNLETTEKEGEWVCPENLVFPVHRAESKESSPFNKQYPQYKQHAPNMPPEGYCDTQNSPSLNKSQNHAFEDVFGTSSLNRLPFRIGQTVLFEPKNSSFKEVFTDETCIKFKNPSCYFGGYYRIEFDTRQTNDCTFDPNQDRYKVCPAFLSVCYRTVDE